MGPLRILIFALGCLAVMSMAIGALLLPARPVAEAPSATAPAPIPTAIPAPVLATVDSHGHLISNAFTAVACGLRDQGWAQAIWRAADMQIVLDIQPLYPKTAPASVLAWIKGQLLADAHTGTAAASDTVCRGLETAGALGALDQIAASGGKP